MTDGRVTRARALREERRQQILYAARGVFAHRGYHASSIADILGAANIARGTFYLHFESKKTIFSELLDSFTDRLSGVVHRVDLTSDVSARNQLLANVQRILAILFDNQDLTTILLREAVGVDTEFDTKIAEFWGHVHLLVKRSLKTGIELGILRSIDPELYAWFVLGGIKEAIAQLVARGETPDAEQRRRLAENVLDYTLRGILRT
ncbi:MAG: TetR/AcrR family transcriptional regulator [Myxococcales bacterium]|nr:TetR/AcrR family transcriptional regulator [Myxococcales bacterium]